jgi:hypothetical protein
VANLSESCTPENDLQLITQVQVAPNNQEDADLLAEGLPALKARTEVETLYVDGGFGSPEVDQVCLDQKVEIVQTGIRGNQPNPDKFNLADFEIQQDEKGKPIQMTCPTGQMAPVEPGRTTGYVVHFDTLQCQNCRFFQEKRCRAIGGKRDPRPKLSFTQQEVNWARRRKRHDAFKKEDGNLRAAIEATARSIKHPFPSGKLPVRGLFRVTCMLIASAAMINSRRIYRYLLAKTKVSQSKNNPKSAHKVADPSCPDSCWTIFQARFPALKPFPGLICTCFGF